MTDCRKCDPIVTAYGVWALFVVLYLDPLGAPLPGESALVASAFLASTGELLLTHVLLAGFVGAVAGDCTGYMIGRADWLHLRSLEEARTEQSSLYDGRLELVGLILRTVIAEYVRQKPRRRRRLAAQRTGSWFNADALPALYDGGRLPGAALSGHCLGFYRLHLFGHEIA